MNYTSRFPEINAHLQTFAFIKNNKSTLKSTPEGLSLWGTFGILQIFMGINCSDIFTLKLVLVTTEEVTCIYFFFNIIKY